MTGNVHMKACVYMIHYGVICNSQKLEKLDFFFLFCIRVSCNSGWSQTYDVAEDNIELHILLPPAGECCNYIHI